MKSLAVKRGGQLSSRPHSRGGIVLRHAGGEIVKSGLVVDGSSSLPLTIVNQVNKMCINVVCSVF